MALSMGLLGAAAFVPVVTDFELLDSRVLTSNQQSVVFSSLDTYAADYEHLQLRGTVRTTALGTAQQIQFRANGDTANNYWYHRLSADSGSLSASTAGAFPGFDGAAVSGGSAAGIFGAFTLDIFDPFNTSKTTSVKAQFGYLNSNMHNSGVWLNTALLTSFTAFAPFQNFVPGSRLALYGLRK